MTCAELIAFLSEQPPETPVVVFSDFPSQYRYATAVAEMHYKTVTGFGRSFEAERNDTKVVVIR